MERKSIPEKPQKPQNVYFKFQEDLKQKNKDKKLTQAFIKKEFEKLSEKEKNKLQTQYDKSIEKWKKDVEKWQKTYGQEEEKQLEKKRQIKNAKKNKSKSDKMEEEDEQVEQEQQQENDNQEPETQQEQQKPKNKKKAPKKNDAQEQPQNKKNTSTSEDKEKQIIGLGIEDPIWFKKYSQDPKNFTLYKNYDVKLIGGKNDAYYYIAQIMESKELKGGEKPYLIWSRSGKIGFQGTMDNEYLDEKEVIKRFKLKFRKSSGIAWDDRFTKDATGKYKIDFENQLDFPTLINPPK